MLLRIKVKGYGLSVQVLIKTFEGYNYNVRAITMELLLTIIVFNYDNLLKWLEFRIWWINISAKH